MADSMNGKAAVTGILSDTYAIATMLHEHGALSFWDFAAAAPYVDAVVFIDNTRFAPSGAIHNSVAASHFDRAVEEDRGNER